MTRDQWRKSSYSGATNDCVEVHIEPTQVHVRDSKSPKHATLTVEAAQWRTFLRSL